MTRLDRTVLRELPLPIDRRQWVASFNRAGIELRQKHCKKSYPVVSWERILMDAMELVLEERRRQRELSRPRPDTPLLARGRRKK